MSANKRGIGYGKERRGEKKKERKIERKEKGKERNMTEGKKMHQMRN